MGWRKRENHIGFGKIGAKETEGQSEDYRRGIEGGGGGGGGERDMHCKDKTKTDL